MRIGALLLSFECRTTTGDAWLLSSWKMCERVWHFQISVRCSAGLVWKQPLPSWWILSVFGAYSVFYRNSRSNGRTTHSAILTLLVVWEDATLGFKPVYFLVLRYQGHR